MAKTLSKGKLILLMVTLCLTNVTVMADLVVMPGIGGLFETFYDQINVVNYIISGAALMSVVAALFGGKLMQYFSKKTLLVTGLVIFAVSAIFGAAFENAVYVAVMRSFVGLSWGLVNVVAMALIAETFVEEATRSKMMGIFNSSMAAVGAVMGLIAGFLAVISWQSVFKVYWVAVPILLMAMLFVPVTPAEGKQTVGEDGTKERITWGPFGSMLLSFFLFSVGYAIIYYQIALYVFEKGLGDESLAGIYNSLGTVGSAIACLVLGLVYPKLRSASVLISYVVMAACFLVLFSTTSVFVAGLASMLAGASFGFAFTYFYVHTTVIVPPTRVSFAIGLTTAAGGLGMFVSTFLATFIKGVLGLDPSEIVGVIPAAVGILLIGGVISTVEAVRERKAEKTQPALVTQ